VANTKVKVKVNKNGIRSMFVPGGEIYRKAEQIELSVFQATKRTTPKRTGYLGRSLRTSRVGSNGYGCNFRVWANADYAKYVAGGTRPIITSHGPWPMRLYSTPGRIVPPGGAKFVGWRMHWVSGQHENNFLDRGLVRGLRRHRLRV
jgi:hypothetical protein